MSDAQTCEMVDPLLQAFRDWIGEIREATGMSQSRIAKEAGIAASTINRPMGEEVGYRVKLDTITKIADATGIDPPEELIRPFNPILINQGESGSGPLTEGGSLMDDPIIRRAWELIGKVDPDLATEFWGMVRRRGAKPQREAPNPTGRQRRT